jgi:hypothetical protein
MGPILRVIQRLLTGIQRSLPLHEDHESCTFAHDR